MPTDLVDAQVVRFKARDGMTIPNILWKPHQATPSTKAPALVWVHGGPGGQTTPRLQRADPVPRQPRLRRARHQQPRQLRLRQDVLRGRRQEARPRAAVGLRRRRRSTCRRSPTSIRTASASSAAATAATWCSRRSPSSRRSSRSASTSSASRTGSARSRAFRRGGKRSARRSTRRWAIRSTDREDARGGVAAAPRGSDPQAAASCCRAPTIRAC